MYKMIYNFNNMFIIKIMKTLQQENKFTMKLKVDEIISIHLKDVEV